jgi:hypothetical protein
MKITYFLSATRTKTNSRVFWACWRHKGPARRAEALECGEFDATVSHGADAHCFKIVGTLYRVGDVPVALDGPLVELDRVSNQREDHHYNMFEATNAIRVGDFGNGNAVLKVFAFVN